MSLPDLGLQIVYARLAWALVLAALLLAMLPRMLATRGVRRLTASFPALVPEPGRRTLVGVVIAMLALMALPGAASPAYWLTLIFQYPSGLLVGCSLVSLYARWRQRRVRYTMTPMLALPLAVVGLALYLDAFGVLSMGLYYGGFGAAAPLLACAAAAGCAIAFTRSHANGAGATAMLSGVLLFSLLRLPTGNLWDALLDPLLWSWALGSVIAALAQPLLARRTAPAQEPALDPALSPELAPVQAGTANE